MKSGTRHTEPGMKLYSAGGAVLAIASDFVSDACIPAYCQILRPAR
jgi:hypothetical protein